uniref:C2H2-type domain-containing protein n=1 Tax=Romanomermis culicivorax TaxID=13658 RepID=A0A915K5L4_ROMCU
MVIQSYGGFIEYFYSYISLKVHSLTSPNNQQNSPKKLVASQKSTNCPSVNRNSSHQPPTDNFPPPDIFKSIDLTIKNDHANQIITQKIDQARMELLERINMQISLENRCCPLCALRLENSRDYFHHLKFVHNQSLDIVYCDKCYYATDNRQSLDHHKKIFHLDPTVDQNRFADQKCLYCDFTTPSENVLQSHSIFHYKMGKFTCRRCTFSHDDYLMVVDHFKNDHVIETVGKACQTDDWPNSECFSLDYGVQVGCEVFNAKENASICLDEAENEIPGRSQSARIDHGLVIVDCGSSATYNSSPLSSISDSVSPSCSKADTSASCSVRKNCDDGDAATPPPTANASDRTTADNGPIPLSSTPDSAVDCGEKSSRKYLREQDAIDLPSEQFVYEENNDPDVKSLKCSICGYEAHWGSEMIRHKRVHTDQRPYKCKYCDRTSKWKADLIRHIYKVHGIRVLSKCSRTFPSENGDPNDPTTTPEVGDHTTTTTDRSSAHSWCESDRDSPKDIGSHAKDAASTPEIIDGHWSAEHPNSIDDHLETNVIIQPHPNVQMVPGFPPDWLIFEEMRRQSLAYQQFLLAAAAFASSVDGANFVATAKTSSSSTSPSTTSSLSDSQSAMLNKQQFLAEIEKYAQVYHSTDGQPILKCGACVYESRDLHTFKAHHIRLKKHGHDNAYVVRLGETDVPTLVSHPTPKSLIQTVNNADEQRSINVRSSSIFPDLQQSNMLFGSLSLNPISDNDQDVSLNFSLKRPHSSQNCDRKSGKIPKIEDRSENLSCKFCPFESKDDADFESHVKNHALPKGIMYYKCAFCDFYSKKKPQIFDHMRLHTEEPEQYMTDVERNLITTSINNKKVNGQINICKDDEAIDLSVRRKNETINCERIIDNDNQKMEKSELSDDDRKSAHEQIEREENCDLFNAEDLTDDDCDDSIDPEAYIHAGEEALGNEKVLFANMVPKDIQKVSALIDGQLRNMWQCRYCTHVSKRRANIRMHEKKHFKPNAIGLLKCPQCNYKGDKRSLKVHYRSHAVQLNAASPPVERFVCQHCPATFRQKQVFSAHFAFHGGHNRYRCSLCSYAVPSQHQLTQHAILYAYATKAHLRIRGSFPKNGHVYQSTLLSTYLETNSSSETTSIPEQKVISHPASPTESCDNGDLRQSATASPIINHSIKSKNRQCRFCPAKFAEKNQLQRHEQFHGLKLKHQCPLCDYSVPFPINLIKHLRAHHNLDTDALDNLMILGSTNKVGSDQCGELETQNFLGALRRCMGRCKCCKGTHSIQEFTDGGVFDRRNSALPTTNSTMPAAAQFSVCTLSGGVTPSSRPRLSFNIDQGLLPSSSHQDQELRVRSRKRFSFAFGRRMRSSPDIIKDMTRSEQEPPEQMVKLHVVAKCSGGWLAVVEALIKLVPESHPLGPAVTSMFIDECPLTTTSTVLEMLSHLNLSAALVNDPTKTLLWHRNVCIVLGCLAEKLAGQNCATIFQPQTLEYLLAHLYGQNFAKTY